MLPCIPILGCQSYPMVMFRENMLKPTPYYPPAGHPQPTTWPSDRITAAWIGHSTVLLNLYGTTILTDPVFSKRLAPPELFGANLGIRRISQLPLTFDQLPPIDIVLLSHAHFDHWDMPTLRRFGKNTQAIIPWSTSDLIPPGAFAKATELPWNQSHSVGDVTITAVHVAHWGARADRTLRGYNGYIIASRGRRIFFAGDSAFIDRRTGQPLDWAAFADDGPFDLSILPIGGYTYRWNHMSPEEAWAVHQQFGGRYFLPIHWRTFIVSPRDREPIDQPMQRLRAAAADRADQIVCDLPGKVFTLPQSPPESP